MSSRPIDHPLTYVLTHPGRFLAQTCKAFMTNQGLLLAGAVAYYTLLSVVPLLILIVIALSHVLDQAQLLTTLQRYLEWLVPGQSKSIVGELATFLENRAVLGWILLGTIVFFSSLAFTVLEKAMSVIFLHRFAVRRRYFLTSVLLPYCFILFLGVGFLIATLVAGALQVMGQQTVDVLGHTWSLGGVSGALLYLVGVCGEVFVLTSIYMAMPVGWLSMRHALVGAVVATVLWEITRHLLVWYFATLSQVSVVYGSLTTAIVVLLSLELGAAALLLGAQAISEYERIGQGLTEPSTKPIQVT